MAKRRLDVKERSDRELVEGSLKGKLFFRETLYKRYFSYAMSVALRYTINRDEAMEVVNDSFLKVLDKLDSYDTAKKFKNWYGRIIINTSIDRYRRRKTDETIMNIETESIDSIKAPEIEDNLSVDDILDLFSFLPEIYKLTFNLYEIEGYDHNEIGRILGQSPSTSRSNLTRAKKMLRQLYNKKLNSAGNNNEAV
ncbi:MAG TPA: sigma-70 family RNA polymerase sigma factor [Bacteroidales bacterium]|nr:sigma-70 family RNA polymerase sigma factor [Bacteroidales bacterium]